MLFGRFGPGDTSDALGMAIKSGRAAHDATMFQQMKSEAEQWKPQGYDAHQILLRHYYEGRIEEHLQEFAKTRFPNTASRMPLTPFNWARVFAETGAAVYDYTPQRYLAREGQRLEPKPALTDESPDDMNARVKKNVAASKQSRPNPDDMQRAKDFATMIRESHLDVIMAEAERRLVLARTMFLRVHSDSTEAKATGKDPRTVVTPFWPSDVLVIPHPRCPTSLATAVAVLLRVSSADGVRGTSTSWECWTRAWKDDDNGELMSFGKWRAELVTETVSQSNGKNVTSSTKVHVLKWGAPGTDATSEEYPLPTLPIIAWHGGIADGCPFLDVDRNLVGLFDTINASLMSEQFAVDMNAATPMIRFSEETGMLTIALGPGVMPTLPRSDTVTAVPLSADFAGIRNAARGLQANLAITHRQRTEGYDVDASSTPVSGVALKIRNEPQAKARLEAIARAIELEARLLALMVEVHDFFRATSIAGEGIEFVMSPQDPPEYEDATERQKRAIDAESASLISRVEARVAAGWSRTHEEATAALAKIDAAKAERPNALRAALDGARRDPFGTPKPTVPKPPANDDADESRGGQTR